MSTTQPTPAPTPRTDGITFIAQPGMMPPYNTVPAEFARDLERELAAKDAEIEKLKADGAASAFVDMALRAERAEAELAKQRSGEGSDGYHTFNELYEHRHALFLMLMRSHPSLSWISWKHHDGSEWPGWFIAGIKTPCGDITYHLPSVYWDYAATTGAAVLEAGMVWDGHTPAQVVDRLREWIAIGTSISAERDQLRAEVERERALRQQYQGANLAANQRWNDNHAKLRAELAAAKRDTDALIDAGELLLAGYIGLGGNEANNGPRMLRAAIDAARRAKP